VKLIKAFLVTLVSLCMFGCSADEPKISATFNQAATLVGDLPANPLQWQVITSSANKADSTMSTLYGNDAAVKYARTTSQHDYPGGSVLSLVTWTQREDERWFGANIPDQARSVEFVSVTVSADGRPSYSYEDYEGTPLKRMPPSNGTPTNDRVSYLLSQRAAVMP